LGDAAWYENNSIKTTHPVGQKKPNAFGLYDMHGNVWQYCADLYDPSANRGEHTVRGGSWQSDPQRCRSAYRGAFDSTQHSSGAGMRMVVPVQ
jgi:formylglycine-generating enzyme required for sulfatase activity